MSGIAWAPARDGEIVVQPEVTGGDFPWLDVCLKPGQTSRKSACRLWTNSGCSTSLTAIRRPGEPPISTSTAIPV